MTKVNYFTNHRQNTVFFISKTAEFIKRFIENNTPLAHIDIADVTWTMKGGQKNLPNLHNLGVTAFEVRFIDKKFERIK